MNTLKSILLVEDDKDDQFFFMKALGKISNAFLFDVANNGKEALDKLSDPILLPGIIFMDINMPVMNGIECLEQIFKHKTTRNIPVIFLTTSALQIDDARKLGARGFVIKPNDNNILRSRIEHIINLDFVGDKNIAYQTFT